MSRWAEFLGEDYMTTHGRFAPYDCWCAAFTYAWGERSGEVLEPQPFLADTLKDTLSSIVFEILNNGDGRIGHRLRFIKEEDYSTWFNYDNWSFSFTRMLTLAAIEERIGPRPQAPSRFEPYTAEYLWWFKRVLDCCSIRYIEYNGIQKRVYAASGEAQIGTVSRATMIAQAEASPKVSDASWSRTVWERASTGVHVRKIGSSNRREEWWASRTDYVLIELLNLHDLPLVTPNAKVEVWTKSIDEEYREQRWVEVNRSPWVKKQYGRNLSQIQNSTLLVFDDIAWPASINRQQRFGIEAFLDLRPGLEFYDPI